MRGSPTDGSVPQESLTMAKYVLAWYEQQTAHIRVQQAQLINGAAAEQHVAVVPRPPRQRFPINIHTCSDATRWP
jgi:hypothetical protein